MPSPVLDIRELSVRFGDTRVLDRVSLQVGPGEILGLVGESGSGKSTLVGAALRTLPAPGVIHTGDVHIGGRDVLAMDAAALSTVRWREAALVPQSALDALNPVLTIRAQMLDTLLFHRPGPVPQAEARCLDLLGRVGITPEWFQRYPHQLSGGMRQRVAIAMALLCAPPLLFLDEPTTALDVIVEASILSELLELQAQEGFSMVFVTHDLPLLMTFATHIAVMYAGRLAEVGPVARFQAGGHHPYTQALLASVPRLDGPKKLASSIPGSPPALAHPPRGCRFHPRCIHTTPGCVAEQPPMTDREPGHQTACWLEER